MMDTNDAMGQLRRQRHLLDVRVGNGNRHQINPPSGLRVKDMPKLMRRICASLSCRETASGCCPLIHPHSN